ncbi:MAG: hypothetical protein KAI64_06530, partial [Thermoplasmata archaeon]|nr:hypothetical protein [Thermoplasmata archaeon]
MKLSKNGAQPGGSMFLMFFVMMIMLLIFLNPGLFSAIGSGIGYVLSPVIGFGGRLPLMTILCASLIMSTISTLIRHHFINWADMAKNQKLMGAFNKER